MLRIGVTGLMASGKSTVARRFEEQGAARIDGDVLGWELLRTSEIRERIEEAFGPSVIGRDGHVDRARLGGIVFSDAAAMERLNAIVQPPLRALVARRLEEAREPIVVLDAAMLTTWRLEPELDGVVEVAAPERDRIARLREARGFSERDAAARVHGQALPAVRDARRRWRIENDGSTAALLERADEVWGEIQALAQAKTRR